MSILEDALRKSARETMKLEDGDYFDSMVFVEQAKAVRELVTKLYKDSYGDFDYILFALKG